MNFLIEFRKVLDILRSNNLLIKISEEISVEYEISAVVSRLEKRAAVLFDKIKDFQDFKVVAGVYADRKRIALALGIPEKLLLSKIIGGLEKRLKPVIIGDAEDFLNIFQTKSSIDVKKIPIPKFYPKDKGPYITAGIVVAKDPETGIRNLSYHRMTPISKDEFVVRVVERDLWTYIRKAEKAEENLEAAVIIGVDPGTAIAAATTVSIDVDELEVASGIYGKPIELLRGSSIDVEYPLAEIVMEGEFIAGERSLEGPFVDISGTYDKIREQPVFKVKKILTRDKPILHAILPAGLEHRTLMGMPREVNILRITKSIAIVKDVALVNWGCGWLECVIAIEKRHEDEPINVGLAAITAHPSIKKVVIVDDDIDIRNCEEVYWAVITRAHPKRDVLVVPRAKGSTLDQSGVPRAKIIIDATKKEPKELFERAEIPISENVKRILERLKVDY